MTFPEKLAALRREYGMTQAQLAKELGVTRQAVSRWELGSSLPDSVGLLKLAEEFDVEPEWLMDDARGGEPEPRKIKRGRFAMADRVFLLLFAVSAAAAPALRVLAANEAFQYWLLVNLDAGLAMWWNLCSQSLLSPMLYFSAGWLAGALVCRYVALPPPDVRRFCARTGCAALVLFLALMLAGTPWPPEFASLAAWLTPPSSLAAVPAALLALRHSRPPV